MSNKSLVTKSQDTQKENKFEYKEKIFCEKVIRQRISDGYLNATDMCKANGKKYNDWHRLESTREYLNELSRDAGHPVSQLIQIKKGGKSNQQGTWIHPYIATNLAQWLSPKFAVFVSKLVFRYMSGDLTIIEEVKKNNNILQNQLQKLELKNKEIQKEKEILEKKQMQLNSFVRNIKQLEKNQIFYLATTRNYAAQSRFEYGGVKDKKDLPSRLLNYNVGRAEGDLYYFCKIFKCNNYKTIEDRIGNILIQFKDKEGSIKEMVHLRYNLLVEIADFICDNYDREIDYINSKCQQFLNETIYEDGIIPEPIDLRDYIEISLHKNGLIRTNKIDVTGWNDEDIEKKITEIINICAAEKKKIKYDFTKQKNSLALELTWGIITPYLDMYKGLTKSDWKERFKLWFRKETPAKLKIKGIKF